jgi:hypothetical protein
MDCHNQVRSLDMLIETSQLAKNEF